MNAVSPGWVVRLRLARHITASCLYFTSWALAQGVAVTEGGIPTYTQVIAVPPGTAGMTPNLALSYTGSAVNGPVGSGWAIQGLSLITRCSSTKAVDGKLRPVAYDSSDHLCLDGQRLIATNANGAPVASNADAEGGSGFVREYRTEKDTFARIRAYGSAAGVPANGPAYFMVWTKAGQIYEYGVKSNTSPNSAIAIPSGKPKAGAVMVWAASRVSDTVGNYIDFTYQQHEKTIGSGPWKGHEWAVTDVRYGGNSRVGTPAINAVRFNYEDRTDPLDIGESYHLGTKNVSVWRLSSIETYVTANDASQLLVRSYKLTYDNGPVSHRSRLVSLTECVGAAGTRCRTPVKFAYSSGSGDTFSASTNFNDELKKLPMIASSKQYGVIPGDFDGDGRTDLLRWSTTPSANRLYLSNGDGGFRQSTAFNLKSEWLNDGRGCFELAVIDVNGDGIADILRTNILIPDENGVDTCTDRRSLLFIGRGDGSFDTKVIAAGITLERVIPAVQYAPPNRTIGKNFYLTDVDADGRLDIITTILPSYYRDFGNGGFPPESQLCANIVCTQVYLGQGDGTFVESTKHNLTHRSVFFTPPLPFGNYSPRTPLVDVNGDGLIDLMTDTSMWIAQGDETFQEYGPVDQVDGSLNNCAYPLDFNGDGRSDCLIVSTDVAKNKLKVSQGSLQMVFTPGTFNLTTADTALTNTTGSLGTSLGDINGDGKTDIIRWSDTPGNTKLFLSNGDGSFTPSTTFNLNTADKQLRHSNGSRDFVLGDFTGRGGLEFLRLRSGAANGTDEATTNQLYVRQDPLPADLLVQVTSSAGLVTDISWVPLTNSASGTLGQRYFSDRGTDNRAVYPQVDLTSPIHVVATVTSDTGVGTARQSSEFAYAGLKATINGRGIQGYRRTLRQRPGANGDPLTVATDYLQSHPYTGVAIKSETWRAALNASNPQVLSRVTNTYCDKTAANGADANATPMAPCATSARIQRPYLMRTVEEAFDLSGAELPKVTTDNVFNDWGDPTVITVTTTGLALGLRQTFTKTTTNTIDTPVTTGDSWILGRLIASTQTQSAPNALPSILASAGSAPNATAIRGTGPVRKALTDGQTSALMNALMLPLFEED